jgi:hypothetical protein
MASAAIAPTTTTLQAARNAERRSHPNGCRGGQSPHNPRFSIPQDHAGPDKANAGHNALQDALHHAAECIGVFSYTGNLDRGEGDDCGA